MAANITDDGWGDSGNDPLKAATQPDNQPGRHDNQPSSRAYAGPGTTPKYGFEAYAAHRINQSGIQMGGKGRPGGFSDGPYKGMLPGQALEAARAEYDAMPDEQRKNWEGTAAGSDIRSSRETLQNSAAQPAASSTEGVGQQAVDAAGGKVMPQAPFTAPGSTPTIPSPTSAAAPTAAPSATPAATPPAAAPTPAGPVVMPPNPTQPVGYQPPFPVPTGPAVAYQGASDNTDKFGPKLSGGGAQPVTSTSTPQASLLAPNEPASSLPSGVPGTPSAVASGPVGAANPVAGGNAAPSDMSAAKPVAPMPPFSAPKQAGGDPDIDLATGKKRTNATSMVA